MAPVSLLGLAKPRVRGRASSGAFATFGSTQGTKKPMPALVKVELRSNSNRRRKSMKTLVSIVAFSLIVAVAAPAFAAGMPKTQAACEKAGMKWDATTKKCSKGM